MYQLAVVIEPVGGAVKAGDDKVPGRGREDGRGLTAAPGGAITKAIADLMLINDGKRWVARAPRSDQRQDRVGGWS